MTSTETAPRQSDEVALATRNRLVITILLVSAFVVILNETLMGVAIPELIDALGITASMAQWLTTSFMLTLAVVIPMSGYLLQRFQTRPVFVTAMSLFTLGTLMGAVSPGYEMLIVARVVQASGTAIMLPLLFTTVFALIPPNRRGRVIGLVSTVIAVAPAVGPSLSGLILSIAEWRWLFIVMIPLALTALFLGARKVVNVGELRPGRLDLLSVGLSIPGFGGLVWGLAELGEAGRSSDETAGAAVGSATPFVAIVALIVGVLSLTLFVWRQIVLQRNDDSLLDLRTFAQKQFALSIIIVSIASMALFGAIILLPLYAQDVLGATPLLSGLIILPGALLQGLIAPWVGARYDAVGPRSLIVPGAVLLSGSLWAMTMLTDTTPLWIVAIANVGISLGLALLFTPLITNGMSSLAPNLNSHGSAIVGTVQNVAGAAGIALFISIAASAGGERAPDASVTIDGVRAALIVGASIASLAIPAVFLVKRTVGVPETEVIADGPKAVSNSASN
ncbi:MAG: MDR family MFS transporter [Microbacteriaceae bacterium]